MAGTKQLALLDIPTIPAQENATVSVKLNFTTNVDNLYFFVDSNDDITESNEDNNLIQTSIDVKPLPDLMVSASGITFSHTDISQGSTVNVKILVNNVGTIASTATKLIVYRGLFDAADKILLGTLDVPALEPGAGFEGNVLWNPIPGEQKISVLVDPENVIEEADENNNKATKDVIINGAQASIIRLYTVPATGTERQEVYSFTAYQDMEIDLQQHWGNNCKIYLFIEDNKGGIYSVTATSDGKFFWNTGNAAPGEYKVNLTILSEETTWQDFQGVTTEIGILLEEQFINFKITEGSNTQITKISSEPSFSFTGKTEILKPRIELLNYSNVEQSLTAILRLKSPKGEVLKTSLSEFTLKGDEVRKAVPLETVEYTFTPSGTYLIEIDIQKNGQSIATKTLDFPVLENVSINVKRMVVPNQITPTGNRRVKVIIELDGQENKQGN